MAALLLDCSPEDEVIVPSFTFVSTANAFALRGARLVFADIRPDTLNLDESRLESPDHTANQGDRRRFTMRELPARWIRFLRSHPVTECGSWRTMRMACSPAIKAHTPELSAASGRRASMRPRTSPAEKVER